MDVYHDCKELLRDLSDAGVRFLVVGAHAVSFHTEPRYTKDFDIWVDPAPANVSRLLAALRAFGAPLSGLSAADFADPDTVFQMGVEPQRIDILMGVEGLDFEKAWRNRIRTTYGGTVVFVLSRADLIRTKRAVGRPVDLLDVQRLREAGKRPPKRRKPR
ncbi:MAG: hypothetical protein HRF43_15165 [Phycisphaerae bacterium]|jgi:hypothetical protein